MDIIYDGEIKIYDVRDDYEIFDAVDRLFKDIYIKRFTPDKDDWGVLECIDEYAENLFSKKKTFELIKKTVTDRLINSVDLNEAIRDRKELLKGSEK